MGIRVMSKRSLIGICTLNIRNIYSLSRTFCLGACCVRVIWILRDPLLYTVLPNLSHQLSCGMDSVASEKLFAFGAWLFVVELFV